MSDMNNAIDAFAGVPSEAGMSLDFDYSNVQAAGGLIPEGTLLSARIDEVTPGKTAKGNQKLSLKLVVITPEYAGRIIYSNVILDMPQTAWVAKSLFEACDMLDGSGRAFGNSQDLLQHEVSFTVSHNTYTDKHGKEKTVNAVDGAYS